jgi:nucleoid-associated protein YgaU
MEFYLMKDSDLFRLPVNPGGLSMSNPSGNQFLTVQQLGEITIMGDDMLESFTFESFFPYRYGPYCEYTILRNPWDVVEMIKEWKKGPVRFVVTETKINLLCTIEEFNPDLRAGEHEDIYYSMTLKQYRAPTVRKISSTSSTSTKAQPKAASRPSTKTAPKTYTVVSDDSLWMIAKKQLKDSSRWPEIAKLNNIKAPYTIYPRQVLKLP